MRSLRHYLVLASKINEASGDLDRSHAARMQRAREQGFNVDEPLYHGTPGGDFDEFDPERTADEDLAYGKGVYASRDPDAASGYSRPGSSWGNDTDDARPTVYKVYMRVKNPFDLDAVYPYAEVKRIFEHCFDEDDLEGIELWTDIQQDIRFDSSSEELNDLEERLMELEYKTDHEDYDPDDYEEGTSDPEYIADVEHANDVEERSIRRQIAFVQRRVSQEHEDHKAALANGRIGGAYGRDIYKALWTNTSEYHDWRAESKLFGGETDTFEFKTEANVWLEELGYDGITHVDRYNPGAKGKSHKVTIAFSPEQVRSAHAMFDPEKVNSRKMHEGAGGGWFYHSTNVPVSAIKRDGLRSSEWDDEEIDEVIGPAEIHHLLFFTDRPQTDFGENVFRFRNAGVADAYSPDRGSFFHSSEPFAIPPASIQVLRNGKWFPLIRATNMHESVEDDDGNPSFSDIDDLCSWAASIGVHLEAIKFQTGTERYIGVGYMERRRSIPKGHGRLVVAALCQYADQNGAIIQLQANDWKRLPAYYAEFGFEVVDRDGDEDEDEPTGPDMRRLPLSKLTESIEDDDAAYYGFEPDWSLTTKWTVIYNRLKQEPNEKHYRDFQRYKALNTEEMKKLRQEPTPTAPEETYKGEHEAPDRGNGAPMHDLSGIFPEDFYGTNGLSHYGGEFPGCYYQVTAMKGRPRGVLKVYRAVPKTLDKPKINPGDWVTIDRRYAVEHGRDNLRNDYRIVSKTVRAKDLYTDGNSLTEWGYDPS